MARRRTRKNHHSKTYYGKRVTRYTKPRLLDLPKPPRFAPVRALRRAPDPFSVALHRSPPRRLAIQSIVPPTPLPVAKALFSAVTDVIDPKVYHCLKRRTRKEVLFATGKGGSRGPQRKHKPRSDIRC